MTYYVDYYIRGHIEIEVEAESIEEAREKAEPIFEAHNPSEVDISDFGLYAVEDETGERTYFQ